MSSVCPKCGLPYWEEANLKYGDFSGVCLCQEDFAEGNAIDGDSNHWIVMCPFCGNILEYSGYFDSGDENCCQRCGKKFYTKKLWINGKEYTT